MEHYDFEEIQDRHEADRAKEEAYVSKVFALNSAVCEAMEKCGRLADCS